MSDYFNATGTIGFTCDNCGRELLGCTWVNGMKFCAKCYQETFGASKDWQLLDKDKTITEQRKQIADLEAKLEDIEESARAVIDANFRVIEERDKLKQQLADAEEHIDALELQLREQYQLVDEKDEQLTEKDKEYQSFKKIADENVNYLKNRILEETKNYNQDKISFAVEQLEKVKECIKNNSMLMNAESLEDDNLGENYLNYFMFADNVFDEIDNQIKLLKEIK